VILAAVVRGGELVRLIREWRGRLAGDERGVDELISGESGEAKSAFKDCARFRFGLQWRSDANVV
jgi:hypothetical protein